MEHYIRSTTYEVPFDAVLSEPGVNWFSDAVPTNLDTGPRAVIGTHGEDEILAACHRDKPSIGLLFPRPTSCLASKEGDGMQSAQATTPPAPDANDGDDDVRMYYIPANLYRSFGVYKDDEDEACLVVAIHKSAFSSAAAQSCGAAAFNSTGPRNEDPPIPQKQSEIQLSILEKAHTSDQWMRLLFYSTDMILAESMEVLEMGQWCLLDEGLGNFLESAPSPNLQHVQVHLTRPVHMSWDVPHSALIWPDPEADNPALDDSDTGFGWLKRYIDDQPAARQSHEPRLLYGPASHPTLAAVHHDRPTIAVSWPSEDGKGGVVTTAAGEQLVDVYVFKPYLYRSGGLWVDEDLQVCLPLHVTFYESEPVDKKGWAIPDADAEREAGVVLLYPQNRVDTAAAIKEWGEWALVDSGKGVGLMRSPRDYPQCEEPPVFVRPLPWGGQRCWE